MLYIQDNFLSEKKCKTLIHFYEDNNIFSYKTQDNNPLRIKDVNNELINSITDRVKNICQILINKQRIKLDNSEIVKWDVSSSQKPHYDHGDVCAAIIYLNDDFGGGKTCFKLDDVIKITPKTGRCVIFSSSEYLHWVEKINNSSRYTLAYWFVDYIRDKIEYI